MKLYLKLLLVIAAVGGLSARAEDAAKVEPVEITGSYTCYLDRHTTPEQAERLALQGARLSGLAFRFGDNINQHISISDITRNGTSITSAHNSINSVVGGRWIHDVGEPTYVWNDSHSEVTCTVAFMARPLSNTDVAFEARVLRNGASVRNEDTHFNSGDEMRLYFKSPHDGYVAAYLLVEGSRSNVPSVSIMLPYQAIDDGCVKVKRDVEYVFFDEKKGVPAHGVADEYTLQTDQEKEYDTLYLIFSTKKFNRPNTEYVGKNLPRALTVKDFYKWLDRINATDPNLTVETVYLDIVGEGDE